jgi:UDP-2,3-diacylglucosamine pyrophosphatase LpxH
MRLKEEITHFHAEIVHNIDRLVRTTVLCLNNKTNRKFLIFIRTKMRVMKKVRAKRRI